MSTAQTPAKPRRITGGGRHPSNVIALIVGVVYTLLGLAGFLITGFDGFASPQGDVLGPLELNPLQNLLHLAIGVSSLAVYPRLRAYRVWGWLVFAVLGALAVYGLAALGMPDTNYLALNAADNVLHAFTAIAGLAVALWPEQYLTHTMPRRRRERPAGRPGAPSARTSVPDAGRDRQE